MSRAVVAWNRVVTLLLGLVLLALGAAAVLWWLGTFPGWPTQLHTDQVTQATQQPWWPWAAGGAGLVLALLGLRWLASHLPDRGVTTITLPGSSRAGRLDAQVRPIASAAAVRRTRSSSPASERHVASSNEPVRIASPRASPREEVVATSAVPVARGKPALALAASGPDARAHEHRRRQEQSQAHAEEQAVPPPVQGGCDRGQRDADRQQHEADQLGTRCQRGRGGEHREHGGHTGGEQRCPAAALVVLSESGLSSAPVGECIERGDLQIVCDIARDKNIAVYVGVIERPADRGGKSIYASLVYIDSQGQIRSVHRKLMPTYDERLTWAMGDGHGLRVHELGAFTVGGLNCWENWMPLARTALYAQGEDLHVAVWPGSKRNTNDITRFIAKESRSYVASVSGLMRQRDFPIETPNLETLFGNTPELIADGGSCIAGPDGEWVIEPFCGEEKLLVATIDHKKVREERQNFDLVGHYSRPDVLRLNVDRRRQTTATFDD